MNSTIWLALALVLVLEGLGPMLYPRAWRRMIATMAIKSWRSRWVPIVKVVVKRAWYACWCRKPARL